MCWAGKLSAGSGAGLALLTVLPPAAVQVYCKAKLTGVRCRSSGEGEGDRLVVVRVRVTSLVIRLDIKLHVRFWSKAIWPHCVLIK